MEEVNEAMRTASNINRSSMQNLMQLIRFLRMIHKAVRSHSNSFTKQDVIKEATKMFNNFRKDFEQSQSFKNDENSTYGSAKDTVRNDENSTYETAKDTVRNEESYNVKLLDVGTAGEQNNDNFKVENVVVPDNVRNNVEEKMPTLTKFCADEQFLRVDVKKWLISEGYIEDMKTVTEKGRDIGIHEIIAEKNNRRAVYDKKAQEFIKSHVSDIEKLSGRSIKKHNTEEYLNKVKSVAEVGKAKNITKDITL